MVRHSEKAEPVPPQDDERQVSESPHNELEGNLSPSEHPSNEEQSSGDVAESVPSECSETVSLEPEPGTEVLNEESSPDTDSSPKESGWTTWGSWGKSLLSTASATVVKYPSQ
ncbi:hypothetical protein lerEdw1_005453 [Lerista edwardsae]|nr:hypothetical protein lerEdw1_005453 [Lerista edwardsae]